MRGIIKPIFLILLLTLFSCSNDNKKEADEVSNFVEFKGVISTVESKEKYNKILVKPNENSGVIDYEKAWFIIEKNFKYQAGQKVLVRYNKNQIHTEQSPPHYGADKITIKRK